MTAVALLLGLGMALWAGTRMPLWPQVWRLEIGAWLLAAVGLHLPYTWLRALRLATVLDPVAPGHARVRVPRMSLLASGSVSFFWLLVLPLRLGEFARPLLLARLAIPGVGVTEVLAATLIERIVDAGAILLMLGVGLALTQGSLLNPDLSSALWASSIFLLSIVALAIVAFVALMRWPGAVRRWLNRVPWLRRVAAGRLERVLCALSGLSRPGRWAALFAGTASYWGVTLLQVFCVTRACDLTEIDLPGVAVLVAVVGLAIQLPAGPGQAGSYQAGNATALVVLLGGDAAVSPLADQVASFVVTTWLLGLVGSAVFAVPGMLVLRRSGWREAWASRVSRHKGSRPTDRPSGE